MPTLNTVDISAYTKSIDMAKVAQQCDTIIIKATEGAGDGENNPFFSGPGRNDWQAARDAGLVRGAYHLFYSRPGSSTPDQQAAHFLNRLAHIRDGDLPPAIDLEPDLSFKGMADRTAAIAAVAAAGRERAEGAHGKGPQTVHLRQPERHQRRAAQPPGIRRLSAVPRALCADAGRAKAVVERRHPDLAVSGKHEYPGNG